MAEKASIMIPDDPSHRELLTEENGYREGFLVEATQEQTAATTLTIEDRETGKHVQVGGVSVSALYGANKAMLHESIVEELDEVYDPMSPNALDAELVAERMLVGSDRTEGLRFVYHERFFDDS